MNDITNRILNRIPNFFDHEDKVIRSIVDAFVPEIQKLYDNVKIVEDIISIEKVHDEDLYLRFGSMFGIQKYSYESYSMYRNRIKSIIASKYGGIKQLIKNTVAAYINITDSNEIDNHIHIYETVTYDGVLDQSISREPGNFIVIIDSEILYNENFVIPKQLKQVINNVKAAGVNAYTTYTFETLYDDSIISAEEEHNMVIIVRCEDSGDLNIYDNIMKDNIHIGVVEDISDGIVFDDNDARTNNVLSLLNSTFITNAFSHHDIIIRKESDSDA